MPTIWNRMGMCAARARKSTFCVNLPCSGAGGSGGLQALRMPSAVRIRHRGYWNARNAVPFGLPASRAWPAGSCRVGQRNIWIFETASWVWSTTRGELNHLRQIRLRVLVGTACLPTSLASAATSRDGSRTSTKKNSAHIRPGEPSHCRSHQRPRSVVGCVRA